MLPPRISTISCIVFLCTFVPVLSAAESLATRIDSLVESELIGSASPIASDAEFLRRASLDLNGAIPTAAEARAFLQDQSPDKRQALIDRLLASPRFSIHMANVFDVMLMERRTDIHVTTPEWQKYLQTAIENDIPYNQLVREILAADGVDPNLRPAAKFFLDRNAEPHLMTRDIGRVFFGMDLQCAQCHDHPLVDHYLQTDYYGLFAFVNRTVVFTDEAAKKSFLGEKSDGEASYKSVFTQDAGSIRPQLPGDNEIDEPHLHQGEDYLEAPLPGVRPVPKYSRRTRLAELATSGSNRQFNLNIANRLWAHMMGRGLVHPVDLHHPLNPPTDPALLELISAEFVANNFNIRWLLREIALTNSYQRSIDAPQENIPQLSPLIAKIPEFTGVAETLKNVASESAKLADAAQEQFRTARGELAPAETAWRTAEAAVTAAKKPVDDALAAIAKLQKDVAAKQSAVAAFAEAAAKSTEAAKLLPNDPEVAAAVATLTARQTQLTTDLASIQKSVTDQTAAMQPLQAKLIESYAPADVAHVAYLEARKPVDAAKSRFIELWNQYKAESLAVAAKKKRLEILIAHENFQKNQALVANSSTEIEARKSELMTAVTAVEAQQQEVTTWNNAVADAEKNLAQAQKLVDETKSVQAEKLSLVQVISEASAKTDAALQKLSGDAELALVSQKLKDRLGTFNNELALLNEQLVARESTAKGMESIAADVKQNRELATAEMARRQQAVTEKSAAVNQSIEAAKSAALEITTGREKLIELWTIEGGVRPLKQLTPEQLAWSLMQATGVLEPQRPAAEAEVEKTIAKASTAGDPVAERKRELRVEQQLHENMRGNVAQFVNLYAASAGQPQDDFFATPDQALFVANGGTVISWASGPLAQKLGAMTDPKELVDELYLAVLTRQPSETEVNESAQYLESRPAERAQAVRELVWSLVTSAEFRFNH